MHFSELRAHAVVLVFGLSAVVGCSAESATHTPTSATTGSSSAGAGGSAGGGGSGGMAPVMHGATDERLLYVDASGAIISSFTDGVDAKRVSPDGWFCQSPVWSPDGKQIAFASDTHGNEELFVMGADGSSVANVVPWGGKLYGDNLFVGSWSPTQGIAMAQLTQHSSGPVWSIWIVSPNGANLHALAIGPQGRSPSWSPAGAQLAIEDLTDSSPITVWSPPWQQPDFPLQPSAGTFTPTWSPDGKWVVYTRASEDNDAAKTGIYRVHPDGTGAEALLQVDGIPGHPSVSRDGASIAFDQCDSNASCDVMVLDVATKSVQRVVQSATQPRYQP